VVERTGIQPLLPHPPPGRLKDHFVEPLAESWYVMVNALPSKQAGDSGPVTGKAYWVPMIWGGGAAAIAAADDGAAGNNSDNGSSACSSSIIAASPLAAWHATAAYSAALLHEFRRNLITL
jgi:hypothetical protein